jgi:upstream activation factor subunit UAF30
MMMMTVSDADIVRRLTSVLKTADLATTTTTAIRQHLEHELGVDLSEKKAFIRQQVDLYLQQQEQEDKDKEEEEEAQGEEEEEEQQEEQEQEQQQQQDEVDDYGKQTATTGSDSKQRLLAKIGRSASKERYHNL